MTKIYVAGPMTGYPGHNFPAFHAAADDLRACGFEVVNPAELDEQEVGTHPWDWYLRRDIPLLLECDAIFLLPGWEDSKGARLELTIARALGFTVVAGEGASNPSEIAA